MEFESGTPIGFSREVVLKHKIIVTILALALTLFTVVACKGDSTASGASGLEIAPPIISHPAITSLGDIPNAVINGGSPAISPAVVTIGNFYPGARAEFPITIYNGNTETTVFSISFRIPDNTRGGYTTATMLQFDWVTVDQPVVTIAGGAMTTVLIMLQMPISGIAPAGQWEFWIAVKDMSQSGFVVTELASRWLINMRT